MRTVFVCSCKPFESFDSSILASSSLSRTLKWPNDPLVAVRQSMVALKLLLRPPSSLLRSVSSSSHSDLASSNRPQWVRLTYVLPRYV
jgi:hypothetical protein